MNAPIENRKLLIIEQARSINNYLDCDYIQDCIEHVEQSETLENIIFNAIDLKNGISFRGRSVKGISSLIEELESIHIKNLIYTN